MQSCERKELNILKEMILTLERIKMPKRGGELGFSKN
jgi:hypothetical protein